MPKKQTTTDLALVVLGIIAWGIAIFFGLDQTVDAEQVNPGANYLAKVKTPNIVAAGAACGFAIAGGLCFLGAAIVVRSSANESTKPSDSSTIPINKQ